MATVKLQIEQLTEDAFRPFGEVINLAEHEFPDDPADPYSIVEGVATLRLSESSSVPRLDLIGIKATKLPAPCNMLRRYKDATVTFIPLLFYPFVVVVAPSGRSPSGMRAFCTSGREAINLAGGIWASYPISIVRRMSFLAVGSADAAVQQRELTPSITLMP